MVQIDCNAFAALACAPWLVAEVVMPGPLYIIMQNDCNSFAALALRTLTGRCEGGMLQWDVRDPITGRLPVHEAALHNNSYVLHHALNAENGKVRV